MTERRPINPWTWQEARGFTQAWQVANPARTMYLSGQGPLDSDGNLVGEDFPSQARRTFENLRILLEECGATLADVVKLTVYLTDIAQLPAYGRIKADYIAGEQPASTALQVPALAIPGMQIEIDAIAVG